MNTRIRYAIGSAVDSAMHLALSSSLFPLTRYVPTGVSLAYDIQRFSSSRRLDVIFDVGANIGQTARRFAQYFPRARLFCFEPFRRTMDTLKANCSHYSNIQFVQQALGSEPGRATVPLHRDTELNSLVAPEQQPRREDFTGEVETISLTTVDLFCSENGLSRIDLLKMDVQGWELNVLKGASNLISKRAVRFIYAEVGFRRADADMQHFAELNDWLEECGYWFCGFYESFRWGDSKQFLGFSNSLYTLRE